MGALIETETMLDLNVPSKDTEVETKESPNKPKVPPMLKQKAVSFSHKHINELLKAKNEKQTSPDKEVKKSPIEERVTIIRMGHKNFNTQLNEFINILNTITTAEKAYGKELHALNPAQSIFGTESKILTADDNEFNKFPLQFLKESDIQFMEKRFGNFVVRKHIIILPEWKSLKQTINIVGSIHLNCARYISNVRAFLPILISLGCYRHN